MKRCFLAFLILFGLNVVVKAQADDKDDTHGLTIEMPEVALLDLESATARNFTMTFTPPTEAGLSISNPIPDSRMWLNYSSIKSVADPTRTVLVKINSNISGGIAFSVFAMSPVGGIGAVATMPGIASLSNADFPLLTGIGSCYTGSGVGSGHNLIYNVTYSPGSYGDIRATNQAFTVTYTLTDN